MSSGLDNWAKKYEEATNSDDTIKAMAKYYTCTFMFDMESAKIIIEMHDGKVKNINTKMSAVIGLEIDKVEEAIGSIDIKENNLCEIANDNCPGQVVISGPVDPINKLKFFLLKLIISIAPAGA